MSRHDEIRVAGSSNALVELVSTIRPDVEHTSHTSSDSSQFKPHDWDEIVTLVRQRSERGPVLVTHGTDTLAWTAAALAIAAPFAHPVVITGSNVPLGEVGSDGHINVGAALQTLRTVNDGVWVVFAGDQGDAAHVIQAGYATKRFAGGRSLCDVSNAPYAVIEEGVFSVVGTIRELAPLHAHPGDVHLEFVWPGWKPSDVQAPNVLLVVYHSATAQHDVISWAGELVARGHRVVAATQSEWNQQSYESSEAMRLAGIEITTLPLELAAVSMVLSEDLRQPLL